MLSSAILSEVRTIVTHARCADGVASALILNDALPSADVLFMDYKSPQLAALQPARGMLFCDFTPPEDRAAAFHEVGTIVLDHHKAQRDLVLSFGERGVFAGKEERGVSGAMLAFREVWRVLGPTRLDRGDLRPWRRRTDELLTLAELAGVRDTWMRYDPRWRAACAQSEALVFYPWSEWRRAGIQGLEQRLALGETLLAKRAETTERFIGEAWFGPITPASGKPLRIAIVATSDTSDVAEAIGPEQADIVVGFAYRGDPLDMSRYDCCTLCGVQRGPAKAPDGTYFTTGGMPAFNACAGNHVWRAAPPEYARKLVVSMRSRGDLDVSIIAKAYGGGGHTHAAGFTTYVEPMDPYTHVTRLIRVALDGPGVRS